MGVSVKIVIINSSCKTSSTGKIAYGLYRRLAEAGNDCILAYGNNEEYPDEPGLIRITNQRETVILPDMRADILVKQRKD